MSLAESAVFWMLVTFQCPEMSGTLEGVACGASAEGLARSFFDLSVT